VPAIAPAIFVKGFGCLTNRRIQSPAKAYRFRRFKQHQEINPNLACQQAFFLENNDLVGNALQNKDPAGFASRVVFTQA
jgi:hypothetical protein